MVGWIDLGLLLIITVPVASVSQISLTLFISGLFHLLLDGSSDKDLICEMLIPQ